MNFFFLIHRIAVVLNVLMVEFALFISVLCCNHDTEQKLSNEPSAEPEPTVDNPEIQGIKKHSHCEYNITPDNEQGFFENKRKTNRLFHSKITNASIKQDGEKTVRVHNISMSKFRKLVARILKPKCAIKKYGLNHRDSVKEISRYVFSKNNNPQVKIKLQDVYGKPYCVRLQ